MAIHFHTLHTALSCFRFGILGYHIQLEPKPVYFVSKSKYLGLLEHLTNPQGPRVSLDPLILMHQETIFSQNNNLYVQYGWSYNYLRNNLTELWLHGEYIYKFQA